MKKLNAWLIAATLFSSSSLVAVTSTWTGASNTNWNNGANWSAGLPDFTTDAVLQSGAVPLDIVMIFLNAQVQTFQINGDDSFTLSPQTAEQLLIGDDTIRLDGNPTPNPYAINAGIVPNAGTTLILSGTVLKSNDLILSGDNSAFNDLEINNTHLKVSAANNLCSSNGSITFFDVSSYLNPTSDLTLPQSIQIAAGSGQLVVDAGNVLTVSGVISESGGSRRLIINDAILTNDGTVILTGVNTFTNGVTINRGTLQVSSEANMGDPSGSLLFGVSGTTGTLKSTGTFTTSREYTLSSGNGVIEVTADQILTHEGTFSEDTPSSPLTKTGAGALYLNGTNTYTGLTTVDDGFLSLNSSLSGDVQVNASGRLGGDSGSMNDLTNNGTVAPGNSIGTLNVVTFNQGPGGNLEIEINPSGATDQILASNTANVDGSLTVLPEPGLYMTGQTFDFLVTQNGLTVTNPFTIIENFPLDFTVNYLPLGGPFTLAQLEILGASAIEPIPTQDLVGNPRSVAEYLFCPPEVDAGNTDFVHALSALLSLTPEEYKKALVNLSPAQFGALSLQNLSKDIYYADSFVTTIEQRMWCERCNTPSGQKPGACQEEVKRTSLWGTALGQWQKQQGIQKQYGFHNQTYGFTLGASHLFTNHLLLSGGLGYSYSHLHWKHGKGHADTNALYITPSIGYSQESYFVNFLAQFAANWNATDRHIRFTGLSRTARGHFTTYDLLARFDAGYKFAINSSSRDQGPYLIVPEGRLSYINMWQSGFSENGAGSLNLNVKSKTSSYLQPEVLVKLLKEFYFDEACVIPLLKLGYIAKIQLSSRNFSATMDVIDCSSDMTVHSFDRSTNQLMLGGGLIYKTLEHVTAGFDYEAHLFDQNLVQEAKIKFDWAF